MEFALTMLATAGIFVIMALAFDVALGSAGILTLAHGAMIGAGAYAAGIAVTRGAGIFVALLAAVAVPGLLALIVSGPTLRVIGDQYIVASLALQTVVIEALNQMDALTGGPFGLIGITRPVVGPFDLQSPLVFAVAVWIIVGACVAGLMALYRSRPGFALRQLREDKRVAEASGLHASRTLAMAYVVSAMGGGLAGALYAFNVGVLIPASFSVHLSIAVALMVIFSGAGNPLAIVIGASLLGVGPELLGLLDVPPSLLGPGREIVYGVALVAVVKWRPSGLFPERRVRTGAQLIGHSTERGLTSRSPCNGETNGAALGVTNPRSSLVGRGLSKQFGGLIAVKSVNLTVAPGSVTGIIGPNGAGKSTLFDLMTGLQVPDEGSVCIGDECKRRWRPYKLARGGVSRSFQDLRLVNEMTVYENLAMALAAGGRKPNPQHVGKTLQQVGWVGDIDVLVSHLSYGSQKLVSLARAIVNEPHVILLDEPASGLTPDEWNAMATLLRRLADEGQGVGVIDHNVEFVSSVSNRVIALANGEEIAEGTGDEVSATKSVRLAYLGT